ncbi:MAG TPA: hypothetical protein VFS43_23980 [Polyangiaceae bacterium]|nr:hypothetical protein [Polyangiaceae bacterium]
MTALDLAKIGYEAYGRHVGWKTFDGRDMPRWDELPDPTRDAWKAAAEAIEEAVPPQPYW